ncbi:HEAT repeat domain-containing protein [Microbispora sp. CA-102843]|uniref:HEAT repeat domain-containing protein n=1 Tax=Microbispora sp. CA-102843 TaxID=3239952 RepID=UPI003D906594
MSQPWLSETPDVIAEAVHEALLRLSGRNGHHTFEDICREFARARITRNIVPATGPVSSGGDQGRDFESFRSFIRDRLPGAQISHDAGKMIVFACTLQRKDLPGKIKSDVATVMTGRQVDIVYAFTVHNVNTATRHDLQAWAQREYDLDLEILDGYAIAERLSDPDLRWIAHRYLGLSRALLFGQFPDTIDSTIRADALARGPIEAIPGLAEKLYQATADEADKPLHAAALFREIAMSLREAGYRGHALLILIRAGAALEASGDCDSAAILYADIVEQYAHTEGPDEDTGVYHRLSQLAHTARLGSPAKERAAAALAVHSAAWHALDNLTALAAAVDALAELEDDHLSKYILALGEAAIASEQPDLILARLPAFFAAADRATGLLRTRINLVIAEVTESWQDIVVSAQRRRLPPPEAALILARYARHLMLTGAADAAVQMWWDAINAGTLAGLGDDTAEWLYAVRTCMSIYGPDEEWTETHPLAQAMRASGGTALLAQRRNHIEDAATALRRQKYARAAHAARRALRSAVTSAHFASEQFALDLLAEIYAETGERARAASLYARSGQTKAIKKLVGGMEDDYLDLTPYVTSHVPDQRAAGFTGMALQGDLVPDEQVTSLLAIALDEWERYCTGRIRQSQRGPSAGMAALKLLAALIERGTAAQASRLLDTLDPLVERESGTYRFCDEAHVKALAGILYGDEDQAKRAAGQLVRMIGLDASISQQVATLAGVAITEHADLFAAELQALARDSATAARLLVRMDIELPDITVALQARDSLLTSYATPPGCIAYASGLGLQACLVTALPEKDREEVTAALVTRAQDRQEVARNRREAMVALGALAGSLSSPTRDRLFDMAVWFAKGEENSTAYDGPLTPTHPLSLFRIDLGKTNLAACGLQLASITCRIDQAPQVDAIGISLMSSADDQTVQAIARALCRLPTNSALTSPAMLIGHPHPAVRALAAYRWAKQPEQRDERIGQRLAHDKAAIVRLTLADTLGESDAPAPELLHALVKDRQYSVRRLARRALAVHDHDAGNER